MSDQSYLEQLVGEGKKYGSVEELAKAKVHADNHIDELKQSADQLRKDLDERMTLEEMLRPQQKPTEPEPKEPAEELKEPETPSEPTPPTEEKVDLDTKIREALDTARTEEKIQTNVNTVFNTLQSKFGDQALSAVEERSKALGVSADWLTSVAGQSPDAFYDLMGIKEESQKPSGAPSQGNINAEALASQNGNDKAKDENHHEYYRNLRKENPRLYYSPRIQSQMFKKAQELGDAFYS